MTRRAPIAERLAALIAAPNDSGCCVWTGVTNRHGYGRIKDDDGRPLLAHRAAWVQSRGPIPDGMAVCHRCDNPPCCNVDHLFLGTQRENMADMRAKGRGGYGHMTGERHGCAKLTLAQVIEIRTRGRGGASAYSLAREYGVSRITAAKIISGRSWRAALAEVGVT